MIMNRCSNRSVSFVERVELEFQGNHFCQALSLGDVDGDGLNEFIIGSVDGYLAIYKGKFGNGSKTPWRIAKGLGTITCTGTGDIFNTGKIQLVCINAAGTCRIFSVYKYVSPRKGNSTSSYSSVSLNDSRSIEISAKHTQELHPNIKVLLVANIAPDSKEELFVGRTDRVVNVYRWSSEVQSLILKSTFNFEGQIGSLSVSMTTEGISQLLVSQTGATYIPLWYQKIKEEERDNLLDRPRNESSVSHGSGYDSPGQPKDDKESIVSMSVSEDESGKLKKLDKSNIGEEDEQLPDDQTDTDKNDRKPVNKDEETTPSFNSPVDNVLASASASSIMDHYELHADEIVGVVQRNNPRSSTEIIGDIRSRPDLQEESKHSNIVALCTLGGAIRFLKDEKKIWEHQVDHNLFSISKLDVTNNGQDEIVVCAWDGTTYILDHSRNVVRYKFENNVCAFTAGYFGFSSDHNKPCLIYTTFSNKIYIYHNIALPSIAPSNLIIFIQEQNTSDKLKALMDTLEDSEKQKFIRKLLYQESDN